MLTAEMRASPQPSSVKSSAKTPTPGSNLFASTWMKVGLWFLAAATLGASLAYMGTEDRPSSAAYALDRDWSVSSPLGVDPAAEAMPPLAMPTPVCSVCGRVEAVLSVAPVQATGRKPLFEVRVRMEDGHTQTVHLEKRLAVGTLVMLEHGVLRIADA